MFCSKCGTALAPNSAFCQVCGTAAPSAAAVPANPLNPAPLAQQVSYGAAGSTPVSPHWLPPVTRSYAGFWLRFVAHLVDGIITGAAFMLLFIPAALFTGLGASLHGLRRDTPPDPAVIAAFISTMVLLAAGSLVAGWLYYAYFESSEWQATLGKKVMNLVVTDLTGNRISFGRASGRFFAKMISGLIPFGIGYIMAGFTERRQALHDMIASCLVLRS